MSSPIQACRLPQFKSYNAVNLPCPQTSHAMTVTSYIHMYIRHRMIPCNVLGLNIYKQTTATSPPCSGCLVQVNIISIDGLLNAKVPGKHGAVNQCWLNIKSVHSKQYRLFKMNPSVLLPCNPRRTLQVFSRGCLVIVHKGSF